MEFSWLSIIQKAYSTWQDIKGQSYLIHEYKNSSIPLLLKSLEITLSLLLLNPEFYQPKSCWVCFFGFGFVGLLQSSWLYPWLMMSLRTGQIGMKTSPASHQSVVAQPQPLVISLLQLGSFLGWYIFDMQFKKTQF